MLGSVMRMLRSFARSSAVFEWSEKGLSGGLRCSRIELPFNFSVDGCAICSSGTLTTLAVQHGWLLLFRVRFALFLFNCIERDIPSMEFEGFEVGFHLVETRLMLLLNLLDV